jgi:hypothetical protein
LVGEFALVWGIAVGVLILQGAARDAYDDFIVYGRALATDQPPPPHAPPFLFRWLTGNVDPMTGQWPWPLGNSRAVAWWGAGTWPLWMLAAVALPWLVLGPGGAPRRLLAGWTLSACVQVALPGMFWDHYYLLPLPGVVLSVAVLGSDALAFARRAAERHRGVRSWCWNLVALATLIGSLSPVISLTRDYLLIPPVRIEKNQENLFLRKLGRTIAEDAAGREGAQLYVWGWQSPLYIYSGLDCATRQVFADFLLINRADTDHPLVRSRLDRVMRDIRLRPPEYIFLGTPPFSDLRELLHERYQPTTFSAGDDGLWVLRDSADPSNDRVRLPRAGRPAARPASP